MSVGTESATITWVSAHHAMVAAKVTTTQTVTKAALLGEIRTRIVPGRHPDFCLEDAEAFGRLHYERMAGKGPGLKRTKRRKIGVKQN